MVCDWVEAHRHRYEHVLNVDGGLDAHLQFLRVQGELSRFHFFSRIAAEPCGVLIGTYGGPLELSAFSHVTRRNVKVIRPDSVQTIHWNAGDDTTFDSKCMLSGTNQSQKPSNADCNMANETIYIMCVSL